VLACREQVEQRNDCVKGIPDYKDTFLCKILLVTPTVRVMSLIYPYLLIEETFSNEATVKQKPDWPCPHIVIRACA
jgi:hypothetical protein